MRMPRAVMNPVVRERRRTTDPSERRPAFAPVAIGSGLAEGAVDAGSIWESYGGKESDRRTGRSGELRLSGPQCVG